MELPLCDGCLAGMHSSSFILCSIEYKTILVDVLLGVIEVVYFNFVLYMESSEYVILFLSQTLLPS